VPRQAKPAYAGYGSVGAGRLRLDSSGLNRRQPMFYQSTKLRPLEEESGLRGQNDGSQPGLGLERGGVEKALGLGAVK